MKGAVHSVPHAIAGSNNAGTHAREAAHQGWKEAEAGWSGPAPGTSLFCASFALTRYL